MAGRVVRHGQVGILDMAKPHAIRREALAIVVDDRRHHGCAGDFAHEAAEQESVDVTSHDWSAAERHLWRGERPLQVGPWIVERLAVERPVHQHYAMLQRNLLYTGVTRGKRLVVLVGQKKAVAIAVRSVVGRRRWSKLNEWLTGCVQR